MVLVSLASEAFIGLVFAANLAVMPMMFFSLPYDSFGFVGAKLLNLRHINEYPTGFVGKGLLRRERLSSGLPRLRLCQR